MKFKSVSCFAVLISAAILSSCGGSSSSPQSGSSLSISSITPTSGSHITINQTFVVQFNNQLDPLSVGKVTLIDESGLNSLINCTADHNILNCVPVTSLAYNYNYNLTLPATIKDTAGNSLTPVTYNYTTYNQSINNVNPPSGAIDTNINKFIFNFNNPMNNVTLNSTQTPGNVVMVEGNLNSNSLASTTSSSPLNAESNVALNCIDIDSKSMECVLANGTQLQPNKNYTIILTDKIQDSNGSPIVPQNVSYQTSNVVTPNVSVNPQGGSSIGLNQLSYVLYFNTLMNKDTVNQDNVIFTDNDSGTSYPLSCATNDSQSYTCKVLGLGSLAQDHKYTLLISNVTSTSGMTMSTASFAYSASNYITPMVNFINPVSGVITSTTLSYYLQFNTPINMDTFNQGVTFTDTDTQANIPINCTSNDSINVICNLQAIPNLTANNNYVLSLSSSITSVAGIRLKAVNYAYAATDYTVPQVESITPNNNGVISPSGATFVVTFNTPIDASSINGNVRFVDNTTKNITPVTCGLTAESVMTCTTGVVNKGDQYSLTLTTGIKSNIGAPLSQDMVFHYTVPVQYVAVAYGGVTTSSIITSPNGVSWTTQASDINGRLEGVAYGNGKFVAVGGDIIFVSADGITWTQVIDYTSKFGFLYNVTYGNGQFIAVGDDTNNGVIVTSPDGINWTKQQSGTTWALEGVTYGNGQYVIVGARGIILTSPDGSTWTIRKDINVLTQNILETVAYGNGQYVTGSSTSGEIFTSSDGITWISQISGVASPLYGSTFANGQFVIVGYNTITSPDGITWTSQISGTAPYQQILFATTYGMNQYVTVGTSGLIMTSPDGVTWTAQQSGTTSTLDGVASYH